MKCPEFTLKEVDLHKWRIFFRDSLIGETSFPVPSEKIGICIIEAINSHEKFKERLELLKQASIKFQCDNCHEWLTVTVQEIIGSDIKLEQALIEGE